VMLRDHPTIEKSVYNNAVPQRLAERLIAFIK
jgi:hypothetical protein